MAITLDEATEATDLALQQCIEEVNIDTSIGAAEKLRLIDIMLETRQKSILALMEMTPDEEARLRRFQNKKPFTLMKYNEGPQ